MAKVPYRTLYIEQTVIAYEYLIYNLFNILLFMDSHILTDLINMLSIIGRYYLIETIIDRLLVLRGFYIKLLKISFVHL